jgi:hypothetical protein
MQTACPRAGRLARLVVNRLQAAGLAKVARTTHTIRGKSRGKTTVPDGIVGRFES